MPGINGRTIISLLVWSLGLILVVSDRGVAERLPVKTYTTADGLPRDLVNRIVRDSRGFLWFCTGDGLSRFDGYEFKTYGTEQGLPHPFINDLIEARDGTYWVATNGGGVCRFNPGERAVPGPGAGSKFKVYTLGDSSPTNRINVLCEDSQGRIWAGTDGGLFYLDLSQDRFVRPARISSNIVYSLGLGGEGSLWIGSNDGLWRYLADGRSIHYVIQPAGNSDGIRALLPDREGKLWVGHEKAGLFELDPRQLPMEDGRLLLGKTRGLLNRHTADNGLACNSVFSLYQSLNGHLWIGTTQGLSEFDGHRFRRFTTAQGFIINDVRPMTEDLDGNLWLSSSSGAMKMARSGFTTFGKADGLEGGIRTIFESIEGELYVVSYAATAINRFQDGKFVPTRLNLSESISSRPWGIGQTTFQDHTGDWWVPTLKGLLCYPRVERIEQLAHTRPKAQYSLTGKSETFDISRLFEDSRGDIWVGLGAGELHQLILKWERESATFHYYTAVDGMPPANAPGSFCEDASGNLWIGFYEGGLARYAAGRFTFFGPDAGMPPGRIYGLYADRRKRLWIASAPAGLARVDDTSVDRPIFKMLTTADGLATNNVFCVTEDDTGRIYAGTSRGVDRLDPETGNVKHYTSADGLAKGEIDTAFHDRDGALWFGGAQDVSRLVPEAEAPSTPPAIFISGVRITGLPQPIADLGETELRGLELGPSQNQIQIAFVGLAFGMGETLQYQYKLEGVDRDWQPLTTERAVNYASLAPGTYRFLVRAKNAEGKFSAAPAMLEYEVLAPVWRRWWFLTPAAAVTMLLIYLLFRYRLARLLELERIRTRIAADLHDDIGSNLTTIAVLSEVVHQQLDGASASVEAPISSIARLSRESVSSMSDIVWAINPQKDSLRDLTRRMRGFASDIFTSRNIDFEFQPPASDLDLKLGANVRRTVYLIFKEAVSNVVRHSECHKAKIDIHVEGSRLVLKIGDDGKGFDAAKEADGNGLQSMRKRAKDSGGEVSILTDPLHGTTLTLRLPTHL